RLICDGSGLALGARIVHSDIQVAEPCDGPVNQVADVVVVTDVDADELRFRAQPLQFGDERLAGVLVASCDDQAGALLGKSGSGGACDAGQSARDQNDGGVHSQSSRIWPGLARPGWAAERTRRRCWMRPDIRCVSSKLGNAGLSEKDFVSLRSC